MLENSVEERQSSCTVGGNVNWYHHYGEQYGDSFKKKKKLGIMLPYDPAIPLLGKYPEETIIEKDRCTPVFTAALFIIARAWKQPRCPWMDKEVLVHIQNEIFLRYKKECIWVSSNEVDKPGANYTEMKSERERQILYIKAYIWNIKRCYWWSYMKEAKETQMERTDFWTQWEKARVGWFERTSLKHVHHHK